MLVVWLVNAFKITKAGKFTHKLKFDGTDGTVTLLSDDELCFVANFF